MSPAFRSRGHTLRHILLLLGCLTAPLWLHLPAPQHAPQDPLGRYAARVLTAPTHLVNRLAHP